jgi:predicted metal-dependent phosphoesterase TrpH
MAREEALEIGELLVELGYGHRKASKAARAALCDAGLTHPGKSAISSAKREMVAEALRARFVLLCGQKECRSEYKDRSRGGEALAGRKVLPSLEARHCEVCGGSNNARSAQRMLRLLEAQGIRRIIVVGGSPASREELLALMKGKVSLRLVSGTDRRTREEAQRDLEWAELVVVWGATQLDHKVSNLYARHGPGGAPVILVRRRGIAALSDEITRHCGG